MIGYGPLGKPKRTPPLLPCPFCGDKARLVEYHGSASDRWSVECGNLGCFVQPVSHRDTKERTVNGWNTRGHRNIDAV